MATKTARKKVVNRPLPQEEDTPIVVKPLALPDDPKQYYFVRLGQAAMFKDSMSGVDLNMLEGRMTAAIPRSTPEKNLIRVRQAVQIGRLRVYDPTLPEPTEPKPMPRKDLTQTGEYKALCHPDEREVIRFIEMVSTKKAKGVLSLKILHQLETEGENLSSRPRPDVVDAIEAALRRMGIKDPRLTEIEVDRITILTDKPEEILLSYQ